MKAAAWDWGLKPPFVVFRTENVAIDF